MEFHDNFVPAGKEGNEGIPAVTLGAGLTWMDVYAAASVDRGLYVQGGGCTSVGVIGWHIGGGYGSFSKMFGTGPANMLEARIVAANHISCRIFEFVKLAPKNGQNGPEQLSKSNSCYYTFAKND